MKILYLAHRIPFPPNKGDKIRSYNEIKYLSQYHDIDLACLADNSNDVQYQRDLKTYCEKVFVVLLNRVKSVASASFGLFSECPLSVKFFYAPELQRLVNDLVINNVYNAVICFSSVMAEYVFNSPIFREGESFRSRIKDPILIMDFCDVDSDKWKQYSEKASFPLNIVYGIENRRLLNYEKKVNRNFDYSVFISKQEADLFVRLYPQARNVYVIANGVDYNYFCPKGYNGSILKKSGETTLLFTGAMDYYANVDGVMWFSQSILPIIKRKNPNIAFYIVGSNPSKQVEALRWEENIKVTGFVKDIRPYYERADVYIAPLRLARGVQNKILEAMSMGKAVVATSRAVEGINAKPGEHLLIADNPVEFADAVQLLLHDAEERRLMGIRAREFVRSNYDWSNKMQIFDKLLSKN